MLTDPELRRLRRQQMLTISSYLLSLGAVATLVGEYPLWIPLTCLLLVSVMSAYQLTRL
jgi:CHASE2 domain-containing sensor protein